MSARSVDPRFNLNDPRFQKERHENPKNKQKIFESEEKLSDASEEADPSSEKPNAIEAEEEESEGNSNEKIADEEPNSGGNPFAEVEVKDDEDINYDNQENEADATENEIQSSSAGASNSSVGAKQRAQLASSGSTTDKTGIVYLSRVPPGMKPAQLRHILEQYGAVGRLYLAPENDAKRKSRKKSGGTGRKCFTEGWVEFKRRKVARAVALALNNQIMGGDRHKYYYYDMWNVKYLPGFKWHHLTEKIAYENQMREKRLRTEISQVKRENNLYLERVERARVAQKIADRREKKKQANGEDGAKEANEAAGSAEKEKKSAPKRVLADSPTPAHQKDAQATTKTKKPKMSS